MTAPDPTCGRVAYGTEDEAWRRADALAAAHLAWIDAVRYRPVRCPRCDHWHVAWHDLTEVRLRLYCAVCGACSGIDEPGAEDWSRLFRPASRVGMEPLGPAFCSLACLARWVVTSINRPERPEPEATP